MSLLIAPGMPALFVLKFFLHQAALLEAAELSALLRQRPLRVRCGWQLGNLPRHNRTASAPTSRKKCDECKGRLPKMMA